MNDVGLKAVKENERLKSVQLSEREADFTGKSVNDL